MKVLFAGKLLLSNVVLSIILTLSTTFSFNVNWSTCLSSFHPVPHSYSPNAIILDSNGDLAITGRYEGALLFVRLDTATGDTLIPLAKYGGNGASSSSGDDIIETNNATYLISGFKSHETISNYGHLWVLNVDPDGDTLWTRTFAPIWVLSHPHIALLNNGNVLVSSTWLSMEADTLVYNMSVMGLSPNGDSLWNKIIYKGTEAGINAMHVRENGDVLLTGYAENNAVVYAVDNDAQILWEKTFDFSENDAAYDIIETADGHILVAGRSDLDTTTSSALVSNSWLLMMDASGDTVTTWNYSFSKENDDFALSLAECESQKGFVAAGMGFDKSSEGEKWLASLDNNLDTIATRKYPGGSINGLISIGSNRFAYVETYPDGFCIRSVEAYCNTSTITIMRSGDLIHRKGLINKKRDIFGLDGRNKNGSQLPAGCYINKRSYSKE